MTEQIIINDVDVSECIHFNDFDYSEYYCSNDEHFGRCEIFSNCYYKKLKRLEKKNCELLEEIEKLKKGCK